MRRRRSARLLVLNFDDNALLFRFANRADHPTAQCYWGTPGGGLEPAESFEQAAVRELQEETGIAVGSVDAEIGRREAILLLPTGERVLSEERYFAVKVPHSSISTKGWTKEERAVTLEYRWWALVDLRNSREVVQPANLFGMWEKYLNYRS